MKTAIVAGREVAYKTAWGVKLHIHMGFWQRCKVFFGGDLKIDVHLYFENDNVQMVAYENFIEVANKKWNPNKTYAIRSKIEKGHAGN